MPNLAKIPWSITKPDGSLATQFLFHPSLSGDVAAGGSFVEESVNRGTVVFNGTNTVGRNQGIICNGAATDYAEAPVAPFKFAQGEDLFIGAWAKSETSDGGHIFRVDTSGSGRSVLSLFVRTDAFGGVLGSEQLDTDTNVTYVEGTTGLLDGEFHACGIAHYGGQFHIYVDGVIESSINDTLTAGLDGADVQVWIGSDPRNQNRRLDGTVGSLVSVHKTMTLAQINGEMLKLAPPGVDARTILGIS